MYNSAKALLKGINTQFAKNLADSGDSQIKSFSEFVKSDTNFEDYLFHANWNGHKEWVDEINYKEFESFKYTIENKDWAFGIKVDRNTLDDSKKTIGPNLEIQIREMSTDWISQPDELINQLLLDNGLAFDNTAFFANSRPNLEGTNTIDNIYTGTGTTVTQLSNDLSGAMNTLRSFKDKNGKPYNRMPKYVVYIPTHLEREFDQILTADNLSVNETNTLKGKFEIIVNDYQDNSNSDWYLMNKNAKVKPLIYQQRKTPSMHVKDEEDKKYIKYFTKARNNAGYGSPMGIIKIDN